MAIHPTAIIDPSAKLADDVSVGPFVQIDAGVEVGPGCEILTGAILLSGTKLGARNRVCHHAVIGSDPLHLAFKPETKSGVRIGDDNVLREMCTIHRAYLEGADTILGNKNLIMAGTHIGHDVVIGNNCVIANIAQISGHVVIEDNVFFSGLSGIHQFARVGKLAMIGGCTGVPKDVPPYCTVRGDVAFLAGLNVIGLRRAGVPADTRTALRRAYKLMFRSGKSVKNAIAEIRTSYEGKEIPAELEYFLAFCEAPSKRGLMSAHRARAATRGGASGDDE